MYEADTTAHQAGLFGLALEELPPEDVFVWDINMPVFNWFANCDTQWRTGMNGATGLDYTAVRATAEMMGFKKKQITDMFPDLKVMENEALITMRENMKDADDS